MTNRTDKKKLDDFDLDFGSDDFNFDVDKPAKPKNKREVVTDLATETIKTVGSNLTDPSFVINVAKKSLPSEYSVAFNAVDSTVSDVRDLYNSATRQARPLVNQLKRASKKIHPQVSSVLPKSISDKLKDWGDSAEGVGGTAPSKEQMRTTNINQEISDLLASQLQQDNVKRNEEKTDKVLESAVEQIRYKDTLSVLTDMSKSLNKVTAYNDTITNKFYQKMITVNYQQLYIMADMLEESKISNANVQSALVSIMKNTSLPEFVKLENSERFKEVTRNKFFGVVNDNLFQSRDKFVSNFITNVKKKVGNKVADTIGSIRNIIGEVESGLEQLQGASELMDSVGEDKSAAYTLAGGTLAGGFISDKIANKSSEYLKKKLKDNPDIIKKGNSLAYASKNMKHIIREKLESNNLDWIPGIDIIRESASQSRGLDTRLTVNKLDDIGKPAVITGLFTRTVNQVIPGLLSRMLRELRIIRTGDVNQDIIEFDFTKDTFNESKVIKQNIKNTLLDKRDSDQLKTESDRLLAVVDPDGKFTSEQKKEFIDFIMDSKLKDKFINKDYLSDAESYRGTNKEMFAKHFKDFFSKDNSGSDLNRVDDELQKLGKYITDNRNKAQLLMNAGYGNYIAQTGIMAGADNDQININQYYKKLLNPEESNFTGFQDTNNNLAKFGNQTSIVRNNYDNSDNSTKVINKNKNVNKAKYTDKTKNTTKLKNINNIKNRLDIDLDIDASVINNTKNKAKIKTKNTQNNTQYNQQNNQQNNAQINLAQVNNTFKTGNTLLYEILVEMKDIGISIMNLHKSNEDRKVIAPIGNKKEEEEDCKCSTYFEKLIESVNNIHDTIKSNENLQEGFNVVNETLVDIRDIMLSSNDAVSNGEAIKDPRRWWNKSILSNAKGAFSFGRKGVGKLKMANDKAANKVKGMLKTTKDFGVKIFNKVTNTVEDVRMKGMESPVLLAWKIKAGHYINADTKKVIKDIKDVTGDIIDTVTNEVVVRKEDIKKLYTYDKLKGGIVKFKDFVINKAKGLYETNMNASKVMIGTIKKYTTDIAKGLYNKLLDSPCDIYIRPKDSPETLRKVLTKEGMINGAYTSSRTKKAITKPSQIDSAIIDHTGKELLTSEDLLNGIYDENGKPIKTGFSKLMQYGKVATNLATKGLNFLYQKGKNTVDNVMKTGGRILTGAKDLIAGKEGFIQINGKKTVDTLEKIYKLLNERLPAKKKKIIGDSNNDGVRDNSYEDIKAKENEKNKLIDTEKLKEKFATGKDKLGGLAGAGVAGVAGLLSKFKNDKKEKEENKDKEEGSSWWKDTALGAAGMGALGWAKGKLGGAAGKKATEEIAKAGVQQVAKQGLLRGAGQLAMTGARLGIQGLFSTGGLALRAIPLVAGLFSAPVLLGIAATAAVGYGLYKGYKYVTAVKLTPLNKVRYAQYGFVESEENHIETVFNLEKKLEKEVVWNDNKPTLDLKKVNIKEMIEEFNVDTSNEKAMKYWITWFNRRFKHILLNSIAARVGAKVESSLSDMDKLQPETKLEYLKLAAFPDGPYNEDVSPFGNKLSANKEIVEKYVQDAEALIRKDMANPTKQIIAGTNEYTKNYKDAISNPTDTPKTKKELSDEAISKMNVQDVINRDLEKYKVETVSAVTNKAEADIVSSRLHPTTAIRLKAYGLKELDLEKVKNLLRLEGYVMENITISSGKVIWKGSVEETLVDNYSLFGLTGPRNKQADVWSVWFRNRFIPVLLAFASGLVEAVPASINFTLLKSITKLNALVESMTVEQQSAVASKMYSAKNNNDSPIWTETSSPWEGYVLNNDIKSIDGNLEAIRKTMKSKVVPEVTTKSSLEKENKATAPTNTNSTVANPVKKAEESGLFSGIKKSLSDLGDKVVTNAKAYGKTATDAISSTYTAAKESLGIIENPGKGAGGDVNSLPEPKAGKTYAAYKELLDAAAKMTGVDPNLLAVMTAMESGFDPKASPGTSAAQGLQQFIPSTWKTMLNKYGVKKYGINPKASPTDVKASSLMAGEYIKENYDIISKKLKRQLTPGEVYAAHMLGAGGASTLLQMEGSDIPALKMTAAAKANRNVFYHNGDISRPRTAAELRSYFDSRMATTAKRFGIATNYSSNIPGSATPGTPGAATTSASPSGSGSITDSKPSQDAGNNNRAISSTPGIAQTTAKPVDNSSSKTALPGKTEATPSSNAPASNTSPIINQSNTANQFGGIDMNKQKQNNTNPDTDANKLRTSQYNELVNGNKLVTDQNKLLSDSYNVLKEISVALKAKPSEQPSNTNKTPEQSNTSGTNRNRTITTPGTLPPPLVSVNNRY